MTILFCESTSYVNIGNKMLLTQHEAPQYMREDSITNGYRQKLSYRACITSWFWIHNETVNIWTHLIGFLIFMTCFGYIIWSPPREIQSYFEIVPLLVQLISYMVCMLSSTLFHTFSCHSEAAHKSWRYTDHFSILFALFGTYVSLICGTFSCFPQWKLVHLLTVMLLFAWVVLYKCMSSWHSCKIPLDIFIYVVLYSAIPFAHWTWLQGGLESGIVIAKMKQTIMPFVSGGIGLLFYLTRFPEKLFTGSVDILGASHQVWHVLIFLGMACWYVETNKSFAIEELSCGGPNEFNVTNSIFDDLLNVPETLFYLETK